jgi:ATP synthase protein I
MTNDEHSSLVVGIRAGPVAGMSKRQQELQRQVARKEARKVRARRQKKRRIWFGLGMFGLIGWAVAIPTVLGIALGLWIDTTWPSRFSWTLMLLLAGLVLGCANAWYWLSEEQRIIGGEEEEKEEGGRMKDEGEEKDEG